MGFVLPFDRGTETLAEWASEAWPLYFEPRLTPGTARNYAWQWNKHVLPVLGPIPLRELDAGLLARFFADLRRQGVGDDTQRRLIGLLSRMFRYAIQEGRVATNPALVLEAPRQLQGEWPEPVAPETVERIRRAMPTARDRLIVSLLGYAGLRPQELVRADLRH